MRWFQPISGQKSLTGVLALFLFILVLSAGVLSINHFKQLGRMSGLSEEYIDTAKNYLEYGMAYPHQKLQYVYRPPGYIFFLKTVLQIPGHIPRVPGEKLRLNIERTEMSREWRSSPSFVFEDKLVFFAQAVLLGGGASILFMLLSSFGPARSAFILALLYGVNVYMIILAGLYHYPVVHIFFVLFSVYVTGYALQARGRQRLWLFVSGVLWGLATLIRPTTLLLPLFFLACVVVYFKRDVKKIFLSLALFVLGMALVIAPQTARNYSLTKRLIPVNAQGWSVFWANTVKQGASSQNHFNWWNVWYSQGMPIYQRVTGDKEYYFLTILLHNLELEDAFKKEAFKNIKNQPLVLAANILRNSAHFQIRINSVLIKMFQAIQYRPKADIQEWVTPGHAQNFHSPVAQRVFDVYHGIMLIAGLTGAALAFSRRERRLLFPALAYGCFVLAHSLTFVGFLHYYIKLPFLFLFAGYAAIQLQGAPVRFLPKGAVFTYGNLLLAFMMVAETALLGLVFIR